MENDRHRKNNQDIHALTLDESDVDLEEFVRKTKQLKSLREAQKTRSKHYQAEINVFMNEFYDELRDRRN